MCLGVPMQVHRLENDQGWCRGYDGDERRVDLSLLETAVSPEDWVLVHMDLAVRVLDADEARLIADALLAVSAAVNGQPFEHLISDLIDREPELPPHLRADPSSA